MEEDKRKSSPQQTDPHAEMSKIKVEPARARWPASVEKEFSEARARHGIETKVGVATLGAAAGAVACALGAVRFAIENQAHVAVALGAASLAMVGAAGAIQLSSDKIVDKLDARRKAKAAAMEAKNQGPKGPR